MNIPQAPPGTGATFHPSGTGWAAYWLGAWLGGPEPLQFVSELAALRAIGLDELERPRRRLPRILRGGPIRSTRAYA